MASVDRDSHAPSKRKKTSRFVAESAADMGDRLSKEYALANEDEGQKEAMKDWSSTIADGVGSEF